MEDTHCHLDVGHLNEGIMSSDVRGPKLGEECPEVSTSEGPEELALRRKACINVCQIAEDRRGPPLVDADWHAFCQAIYIHRN